MSRQVDEDFAALGVYLGEYDLGHILDNEPASRSVKMAHRTYLSLLHLWEQVFLLSHKKQLRIGPTTVGIAGRELAHFREAVSDVGCGLFCCIHGVYKAGHMSLRSSIENFLRFICGPYDANALVTTSVRDLFEIARGARPFLMKRKGNLSALKSAYSELCKYSHSAGSRYMSGAHGLMHFPSHDAAAFHGWNVHASQTTRAMAATLVLECPNVFLKAHFSAREMLELLLPEQVRLTVLGARRRKGR